MIGYGDIRKKTTNLDPVYGTRTWDFGSSIGLTNKTSEPFRSLGKYLVELVVTSNQFDIKIN